MLFEVCVTIVLAYTYPFVSGFTLSRLSTFSTREVCIKDMSTNPTNTLPKGHDKTLSIHKPWIIAWLPTDTPTLSPSPPELRYCTNTQVSTWVPGSTVSYSPCYTPEVSSELPFTENTAYMFGAIGVPLIVVGLTGLCYWYCCIRPGRKKRERAARKEREQLQRLEAVGRVAMKQQAVDRQLWEQQAREQDRSAAEGIEISDLRAARD